MDTDSTSADIAGCLADDANRFRKTEQQIITAETQESIEMAIIVLSFILIFGLIKNFF